VNSGNGPTLQPIDIGHPEYAALVDPDTAFWSLVSREKLADHLADGDLLKAYRKKKKQFAEEMQMLRFGLQPSAVYFNPTARCNFNCSYCYIPEKMRKSGPQMSTKQLLGALKKLKCVKLEWSAPDETGRSSFSEIKGSEFELDSDLALLAMGFTRVEHGALVKDLGLETDPRGNVKVDGAHMTSADGVFAAGDSVMGASLVVRAIDLGRQAAAAMDAYLRK